MTALADTADPRFTDGQRAHLAAFEAASAAPESYACTCGHEGLTAEWHADTCGRVAIAVDPDALDKLLRWALPDHQTWCHGEAHGECCGAGDCDCGVADSLERLLPVVDRIANERAAAALRDADVPGLAKSYAADRVRAAFYAAADAWPDAYASSVSDWLRDRADELDGAHPCSGRFCRTCADEATS